ncbi:hypothetical protein BDV41DRAFT_542664 [Aspergillus transmontanensis]|uniref:Uncharacterized protein n=1 Tax=Aspergillus transmontanensis TaxID=1034304 RepID=A0A5N6VT14_9EURO|nr:hypothetical protein BDV41DRAFT_542664 [Aspergillus transmontanensis]
MSARVLAGTTVIGHVWLQVVCPGGCRCTLEMQAADRWTSICMHLSQLHIRRLTVRRHPFLALFDVCPFSTFVVNVHPM